MKKTILTTTAVVFAAALASSAAFSQSKPTDAQTVNAASASSSIETPTAAKKAKKAHVKRPSGATVDLNTQAADTSVDVEGEASAASSAASVPPVTGSLPGNQSSSSASASASGMLSEDPASDMSQSASASAEPAKPAQ